MILLFLDFQIWLANKFSMSLLPFSETIYSLYIG